MILIIPAYNEEKRLPIEAYILWLKQENNHRLIFVNDGSKDNTIEVLNKLKSEFLGNIEVLDLQKNVGKAMAVHAGFNYVFNNVNNYKEHKAIGYLDADLATPLSEAVRLNDILLNSNLQLVFGSRILKIGSDIKRKGYRHYLGRVVATFISMALKLPIYDTQCGAKLFRLNEITSTIFRKSFVSRWLFDVEIFFRIKNACNFNEKVKEEPLLEWTEKGGSKITFKDTLKIPFELIKIYRHESKS